MKKEKKGRPTSIRLLPETEKYLMRCPGKNLTDKFEYLIHFCMKREEMLVKVEEEYQRRFKAYEEDIKSQELLLRKLRAAAQKSTDYLDDVVKEIRWIHENNDD
ncbi:MAG: hypothetical protein E7249_17455 [Paenibacillaceae bacterium]|nr:hypothetical protein [Paenibacillaceae bacterium]